MNGKQVIPPSNNVSLVSLGIGSATSRHQSPHTIPAMLSRSQIAMPVRGDNPDNGVATMRPLCLYPARGTYNGKGDLNEAASSAARATTAGSSTPASAPAVEEP